MGKRLKLLTTGLWISVLAGCSSTSELNGDIQNIPVPEQWGQQSTSVAQIEHHWLKQFDISNQLSSLVQTALRQNFQLQQLAYGVAIKQQQLIASGSYVWPTLDVSLSNSRRKTNAIVNSHSVGFDAAYEIDIWGKLSDNERQANLNFLAEQTKFQQSQQQLAADVVTSWFAVIEAQQLLALYQKRVTNAQQNLDIIEMGFRQGLNKALDVYLARNEFNNEVSRVAAQRDGLNKRLRQLERLIGDYPKAQLAVNADLPLLQDDIPLGLPSELISRKPSLVAAWYQLLAKDAGLAFAHKQRFPSLSLRASISKSSSELSDLLSGATAWSIVDSLTMPIFNGGKLKANEQQARLVLKQGEQIYLDSLYSAFSEVENAIAEEATLKQRYQAMIAAQTNALAAEILSFEQYKSGLVSYTTVLDAQSRAFDAQSTVIQLKNQLIANRVKLHVALGGDFASPADSKKVN